MPAPIMTRSGGVTCRLSVPAELEAVRETVRLARDFLAEQNVDGQNLIACELALVEACNNAVAYSSPLQVSSSPRKEAHSDPAVEDQSLLTSAATIEIELCC